MRFRYIGEVPDGISITMYGAEFTAGGEAEISDPVAIGKLKGNRYFEVVNDADVFEKFDDADVEIVKRKRGRPKKAKEIEPEDMSDEPDTD